MLNKRIPAALCVFLLVHGAVLPVISSHSSRDNSETTDLRAQVVTLIVNEFLADPPDGAAGDANGDGIRDSAADEFVEIVNNGTAPINVGLYTISDSTGPPAEFTFPPNKIIPPGEAAIVFGGGMPAGAFGNCSANGLVFTAGGSGLSLNNGGDTIIIRDNLGMIVATLSYTAVEGGANQSITRSPDIVGAFVQHSTAPGSSGSKFSPGARVNGAPFTTTDPVIASVSPEGAVAGSGEVPITITGSNFQNGSRARVDGVQVTTQFLNSEMLIAEIPAPVTDVPGTRAITVQNPDSSISNSATFTVLGRIGINEFLADPPDGPSGDANGDGARDSSQDEFVEIINRTGAPLDAGGITIRDADAQRFAFPSGTIIPPGEAAIIFGGGSPRGEFGNAQANGLLFTAGLSLNNTGDTITIQSGSATIESVAYGTAEGSANQSINRNPDAAGIAFAPHATISGSGGRVFSPGTQVTGAAFTIGPRISSIAPESAQQSSPPFDLTITGTGFDAASTILIDGRPIESAFRSSSQLIGHVPASVLATSGQHIVQVRNDGGNLSNAVTLSIIPPPPSLLSITPRALIAGSGAFTLFLSGLNFAPGAVALVDGTAVATTFISSTQLRATVPASFIATVGQRTVIVRNSDGKESRPSELHVLPPATVVTSITPALSVAGGPSLALQVRGANFKNTATVLFDQTPIETRFLSSTELTAQVLASLISEVGVHAISVQNAGEPSSNEIAFQVLPNPPFVKSIEPSSVTEGSGDVVVTLTGEKIQPGAVVRVVENLRRGPSLESAFINSEQIQAKLPSHLTQLPGVVLLGVENPDSGFSNAAALKVLIRNPLVINEYLSDPPEGPAGDANGDGTRNSSSDEFIEILNRTSEAIDLSGYKLLDAEAIRHAFPEGTVLPPFEVAVVFGGGTPSGDFGNATANHLVFKASSGGLSLNNGGDSITLQDVHGLVIQEIKFGLVEGAAGQSFNRDPDGDGPTFAPHTMVAEDSGRLFSPGTRPGGQAFTVKPVVRAIAPASVRVGSVPFVLKVSGNNFLPGAVVLVADTNLPTTHVSDSELEAQVAADLVSMGGVAEVRVKNPKGEVSDGVRLSIVDDPPRVKQVSPQAIGTGAESIEVVVNGERFQRGASVFVQGAAIETTFVSSTSLVAKFPDTFFAHAAELQLQVHNADGNRSNAVVVTVESGPLITRLSKRRIKAGRGVLELTAGGVAFKPGIVLFVNEAPVNTSYVSDTQFTARIPAEMTGAPGLLTLRARNPDGGRSNVVKLRVVE